MGPLILRCELSFVNAIFEVLRNFQLKFSSLASDLLTFREFQGCVPVFLDDDTVDQYYNGYCNNVLWPLFHYIGLPQADRLAATRSLDSQFQAYQKANKMFADVVFSQYQVSYSISASMCYYLIWLLVVMSCGDSLGMHTIHILGPQCTAHKIRILFILVVLCALIVWRSANCGFWAVRKFQIVEGVQSDISVLSSSSGVILEKLQVKKRSC